MKNIRRKIVYIFIIIISFVNIANADIKFNRNIPNEAHNKIKQLLPDGIQDFSFSPNGGWLIISKKNELYARNIPNECYLKIKELIKRGHQIKQVSFPPRKGGNSWVIVTDKTTFSRNLPVEAYKIIKNIQNKGKKINSISFPYKNIYNSSNNAWVIITSDGSTFSRNIPDECYQIINNIKQSDMPNKKAVRKISRVIFTPSGGWVVLADDYFFTRNISNEAFKQLKVFSRDNYKSNLIAFTPNGKGFSIVASNKNNVKKKDLIREFESNVAGESIWKSMIKNKVPGVSVSVVINGDIAWSTAYGHLKKGEPKYATHPESMFQAASISKVFAAVGAHKLIDQNKVTLTENLLTSGKLKTKIPLHKCLNKEKFKTFSDLTIYNILQHRSGIEGRGSQIKNCKNGSINYKGKDSGGGYSGYNNLLNTPSMKDLMKPIRVTYKKSTKPNNKSSWYSGKAFTVLQKLTEDITNQAYSSWMKAQVLNPMGMYSSRFTINPEKHYKEDSLSRGHDVNGETLAIRRYPQLAAAGLYTNAKELANMIIMINNDGFFNKKTILSSSSIKNLVDNDLGVYVGSNKEYYHGGTNDGFKAYFIGFTNINKNNIKTAGIVVLTNGDDKDIVPKERLLRSEIINSIRRVYGW